MNRISALVEKASLWIAKRRALLLGMGFALLVAFPFVFPSTHTQSLAVKVLLYTMLAASLNVINGYSGQFNIGHMAFYCVGAYTYAILATRFGVSFWICLLLSGMMAMLAGILVALPTLRLQGMYLAMVTLGAAEIVNLIASSWTSLTNGALGIKGIPAPVLFSYRLHTTQHFYFILLALAVIMYFLTMRVINSRVGRAWMAIREDQNAARFLGVRIKLYKSINFAYGAFWAGVAGCVAAAYYQYISPGMFSADKGNELLSMLILGGQGTMIGPMAGSLMVISLTEILRFAEQWRMVFYSVLIILMMWFRPQGLMGARDSVLAARLQFRKHKRKV